MRWWQSPQELRWDWPQPDQLVLSFSLPPGTYATSVLEILSTQSPRRHAEGEPRRVRSE